MNMKNSLKNNDDISIKQFSIAYKQRMWAISLTLSYCPKPGCLIPYLKCLGTFLYIILNNI